MVPSMKADIHKAIRDLLTTEPNAFRRDVIDIVSMNLKCHPQTVRHALNAAVDDHQIIVQGRTCSATLRWVEDKSAGSIDDRNVVRGKAVEGMIAGHRYFDGITWGLDHCLGLPT